MSLNPAYLTTNSTLRQLGWAIPHSCETISSDVVVKTAPCPPQSRVYNCVANIRTIMTCASILSSPPSPAPPITKSLSKTDPNGCLPPSLPAGCHCMQRKIFEVRKKYEVGKICEYYYTCSCNGPHEWLYSGGDKINSLTPILH